jgi:amidase
MAAENVGLAGGQWRTRWHRRVESLFDRHDVLLTPTLATPPIEAKLWSERSWLSNLHSCLMYAPFCAAWNLAGFPAVSVPAGMHTSGTPLAVQFVGKPGSESLLLGLAAFIEREQPWPRTANLSPLPV